MYDINMQDKNCFEFTREILTGGNTKWNALKALLKKTFIRILILDIHRKKEEGKLKGDTPEMQYDYYTGVWLKEEAHIKELCAEFPEMERLTTLQIERYCAMEEEIARRLKADREQIIETFCNGQAFDQIVEIGWPVGDSHNGGRRVVKVFLDNGTALYYKPHSLWKNERYQEVYGYLCKKAGLNRKEVKYLSRDTYGWEENIENKCCHTKEEVRRYYFRMGIHLFIGYALSATDLHGENMIAHGEHPVIVDMETFPGYFVQTEESSVEKKIETILKGSVVRTGMLPVRTWGQGKQGAVVSAVNSGGKITTPFRMPVIKRDKTSEIHIDYEPLEFELKQCMARLKKTVINAGNYAAEVVEGFRFAYKIALEDQQINGMLEKFFCGRSRVILRHTQQYAMYQIASLHPDYMKNREQREKLLDMIHKAGETQIQKAIHEYEISALIQMDIPYFETDVKNGDLYDGDGNCYTDYFPCSFYEAWKIHMSQMNHKDMNRQSNLIRLSMALLGFGKNVKEDGENQFFFHNMLTGSRKTQLEREIQKIVTWICDSAVVCGNNIGWIGLRYWSRDAWDLEAVGMYFYNGISGIAVLLAEYLQDFTDKRAEWVFQMTVDKMIRYTQQLCKQEKKLKTGLYDGEASIIYSYILLYKITGDKCYLHHGEKHFEALESFAADDICFDLLSGNAGAIVAALSLYRESENKKYFNWAVQTEKNLWLHGKKTGNGFGWIVEGMEKPLSGMAHGNSGFLTAYADLYEISGDKEYLYKIKLLLEYEASLYSEKIGNWLDLRQPDSEGHVMNAWCHGAPGILLSRLKLEKTFCSEKVLLDIQRGARALFAKGDIQHICLCHGLAGRLLIMREYLAWHPNSEWELLYDRLIDALIRKLNEEEKISASEYLNPGFMNGITGVGFALIELYKDRKAVQ